MTSEHGEQFLKAFVEIEQYLRARYGSPDRRHEEFGALLSRGARDNPALRQYKQQLQAFAELRNFLSHERLGGRPMAIPGAWAVSEIERIASILDKPPAILEFCNRQVQTVRSDQPLAEVLELIGSLDISQIPVYTNGVFVGLLTTNAVARWLAANVTEELVDLTTLVDQVLGYREEREKHEFVDRNTDAFRLIGLFDGYEAKGEQLSAVLVTHSGRASESLLGIATAADLPRAFAAMERRAG